VTEKKKILIIADSPLVPTGVGTQTRYMIESLIETGKYQFLCLAGAVRHSDYSLKSVDKWGNDWLIKPVNGYGDKNVIRSVMRDYKPDLLWFMTDPRFFIWLWEMENEIRKSIPMIYYHVWDNYPPPEFNKKFYDSNDLVCTISKLTDDIVKTVAPNVESIRVPHAVNTEIFKKKATEKEIEEVKLFREKIIGEGNTDKLIFFWNNRNARRKQSGTLIYWFKDFLNEVGEDKAILLMHTEPNDPNGPNLIEIAKSLDLGQDQVLFSSVKLEQDKLSNVYNAADCTINISDAEGFGLSTLESLACETPIIVNMTGGLQEQVTDGKQFFGYGIEPSSKTIVGSQDVPYIFEDRISKKDFLDRMIKICKLSKEERQDLGRKGRQHVMNNYSFEKYHQSWHQIIEDTIEKHGSWNTRKNYKSWEFKELK
jgi:glycosyltransferase involved in cell wall biosynthesis